jgi:hypothetical protein
MKSRIGLVLAIAMLFTFYGSNMAALADTLDYSDSLTSMHELGIISSSVTNVNSVVTRGEFLKAIVASEGMTTAAANSKGSTVFSDITPNSDLSGYINAGLNIGTDQGVNEGVVYGTADGTYKPNSAVTYAEACTVMVRLLGYSDTDSVLENASWPNNYIQEASTLGLTTGVTLNKSSSLTVGVEAVLFDRLFNSLMKDGSFFSDNYYGDTTVTGTLTEVVIYGNSTTSDNLAGNQILTSAGTLTLQNGLTTPVVGGKYKLYVDGTTVTKVTIKENTLENYTVKSVSPKKLISYVNSDDATLTMTLPKVSAYYYHGEYVDYATAVKSVYASSTIVLAKKSSGSGYEYGIIVDPYSDDTVVSGTLTEVKVLGNSKTSDDLADNQILTDIGTLTVDDDVTAPEIGGKYELYVDTTTSTVTKVVVKENTLEDYAVTAASSATKLVSYTDDSDGTKTITLPSSATYYYHGKYVDYATALKAVQCYSSIILAKSSSGSGYEYGLIIDPCFNRPYVYKYDNVELLNKLNDTTYDYMYREVTNLASKVGNITKDDLNAYDVVYFVSDIWGKHTFVYVYDKTVIGTISAFVPDKISPTGLTISSTTYSFSSYFDKNKLSNYTGDSGNWISNISIGDCKTLVLGVDGTIVDIY